jgi:Orsellinic acid/F9775 biosynthesis cluster protein D
MSEQYIKYEPRLRVMICRPCQEGVTKKGIARHYRGDHKNIPRGVRQGVVEYCNNFDLPYLYITGIEGLDAALSGGAGGAIRVEPICASICVASRVYAGIEGLIGGAG